MGTLNKNSRSKTISLKNANAKFDRWFNRRGSIFRGVKKSPIKELFFMGLRKNFTIKD